MNKEELANAKKVLKALNDGKWLTREVDEALQICKDFDPYCEFIDEYMLDEIVKNELEKGGATRVMCLLAKCYYLNPPFGWRVNGYGNIEETTIDDIILELETVINNEEK